MNKADIPKEVQNTRHADHKIDPLIFSRWSPRAMTGESISDEEFASLLEAARWAPSSYNNQPWRFVYAKRDTPSFHSFVDLLVEFNQEWAKQAAVLGVIGALKVFELSGKPSVTHAFDTGAAWENLCLEGTSRGLVVHGMQGFDYAKAQKVLEIPENVEVLAMFAVGKKAPKDSLSEELQKREQPGIRKKISEFAFTGKFGRHN